MLAADVLTATFIGAVCCAVAAVFIIARARRRAIDAANELHREAMADLYDQLKRAVTVQ